MTKIGDITHYFNNIEVGIIKLTNELKVGYTVKIVGNTTDFEQQITEMQIDRENIETAKAGEEVGVRLTKKVRVGDEVFLAE